MSILSDALAVLDRWGWLKGFRALPARIEALEKRIGELEERLKRAPGDACPSCGALEYRVKKSERAGGGFGELGERNYHWSCGECGFGDVIMSAKGPRGA